MAHEQGSDMSAGGLNRGVSKAFRVTTALVVGALAATTMGGCSSAKPKAASSTPSTTRAPTSTVVVTNPLTGVAASPNGPVIAVKLDDTAAGRPSLGVDKADVIYLEEVEGGLSRILSLIHI